MSGAARRVSVPVADLLRAPGGQRDRQLQAGASVEVLAKDGTWCRVRASYDGYEGWVAADSLAQDFSPTHRVSAHATHLYEASDFKTPEGAALGEGATVAIKRFEGRWAQTQDGRYLFADHLTPLTEVASDPVAVAELYLGTPYLWGGNSVFGVDCSGLVQAGCRACGIACAGDSSDQRETLGRALDEAEPLKRGDAVFWDGHVALVAGSDLILHATAAYMAVVFEPLAQATARISTAGEGPVLARRRYL